MSSSTPWQQVRLVDLGALSVRGADAVRFLQGQLSNDIERLTAARSQLAALHNPQGRAIAVLRLVQLPPPEQRAENAPENPPQNPPETPKEQPPELLALLPRELAAPVAARLSKFILRSKVSIREASDAWEVRGLVAPEGAAVPAPLSQDVNGQAVLADGSLAVRVPGERPRWLLITHAGQPLPHEVPHSVEAGGDLWRRLDIEAGLAQVRTATSESFVAQMLNLDLIDAVSFDKGCYTGQEVIARAHWRGRVKRRMQRFVSRGAAQLVPGDTRTLADGRSLTVVEAVAREDGRCELLGVTALAAGESEPAQPAEATPAGETLDVEALPLPYSLP